MTVNIHYAGPREAAHHAIIGKILVLTYLLWAETMLGQKMPILGGIELLKSLGGNLGIEVICHAGAVFVMSVEVSRCAVNVNALKAP